MIDIKQNSFLREIPENLLIDERVGHLAKSLQSSLSRMLDWVDKVNYTTNLDIVPDEILDHLLWENHIGYDEGLVLAETREQKINLIQNAIELHRIKGTPYAIELVLKSVQLKGEVLEWFEYAAEPYHFIVELEPVRKVANLEDVRRLVLEYKNTRSFFDGFVMVFVADKIFIFDDSYHYPVFYKSCGTFSGEKEFGHYDIGEVLLNNDTYDYIVEYPVAEKEFTQVDLTPVELKNDTYDYIKEFPVAGKMPLLTKEVTTLSGGSFVDSAPYEYSVTHPVCGEFYAEGE